MTAFPQIRSALVSDALDSLGLRTQCLRGGPAPLVPGMHAVGPAFPLETVIVDVAPVVPYRGLLEALDAIPSGAVAVLSAQARTDVALWGELLSTICVARGASGTVCDGPLRDAQQIRALGYPVFANGTVPNDINGRLEVVGHTRSITIGAVEVAPGDLIVADDDGVVIVPISVIDEVVDMVREKTEREGDFRAAIQAGGVPSEVFERFRVL